MNSLGTSEPARSDYWDIVKGVAIILVILGHSFQYSVRSGESFISNPIWMFIYGLHMPLFMMVSGFFFFYSLERHNTKTVIVNRIRQCVMPIATITLCVMFLFRDFSIVSYIHEFFGERIWFLWCVLYLSVIVLIFKKLPPPVWIVGYFITFFIPKFYISHLIWYMFPYFICGYLFNRYKLFDKLFVNRKLLLILTILTCLIYLVLLGFSDKETFIYWSDYTVLNGGGWHQALINIKRTFMGFCGVFFTLGIIRLTYLKYSEICRKSLCYLGKNTLQLYVISTFPLFQLLELRFGNENVNYVLAFATTIIVLAMSIVIVELLKKNRITNFMFFGHRIK